MTRLCQDFGRGTFFDDASRVHHGDALRDLRYHAKIVGYEKQAELQLAAETVHPLEPVQP